LRHILEKRTGAQWGLGSQAAEESKIPFKVVRSTFPNKARNARETASGIGLSRPRIWQWATVLAKHFARKMISLGETRIL